jgi:hypothetical protein
MVKTAVQRAVRSTIRLEPVAKEQGSGFVAYAASDPSSRTTLIGMFSRSDGKWSTRQRRRASVIMALPSAVDGGS